MRELISVIVPIYKVENYLTKCIESIQKQTYNNLEIILVDDGSPDNCGKLCDEYAKKDKRIVVIHKENGGLSDARNAGLEIAKGAYVAFVDADDYIHSSMLHKLSYLIEKFEADIAVCDYKNVYENDTLTEESAGLYLRYTIIEDRAKEIQYYFKEKYDVFTVTWNKLYKRELFETIRFPKGKIHEDEFTTYKLLYNSKKTVYLKEELYYYLQRSLSIMGEKFTEKRLHKLEAYQERLAFYQEKKEYDLWANAIFFYKLFLVQYKQMIIESCEYDIAILKPYIYYFNKQWNENYKNSRIGLKQQAGYWIFCKTPKFYDYVYSTKKKWNIRNGGK